MDLAFAAYIIYLGLCHRAALGGSSWNIARKYKCIYAKHTRLKGGANFWLAFYKKTTLAGDDDWTSAKNCGGY